MLLQQHHFKQKQKPKNHLKKGDFWYLSLGGIAKLAANNRGKSQKIPQNQGGGLILFLDHASLNARGLTA